MWYTKEDTNANDYRSAAVSGVQHCFCRESSTTGGKMISRESGIFGTGTGKKRVKELRAIIEKNNRLYYDQDAPELEDLNTMP